MLNDMRVGKVSDETVRIFKSLSREIFYEDDIQATELLVIETLIWWIYADYN
jgi:hypothetical protein